MNNNKYPSRPEEQPLGFPGIEFAEQEVAYLDQRVLLEEIIEKLTEQNLYKGGLLYCGIEGTEIRQRRTFGDRRETYALAEEDFREAAELEDDGRGIIGGTPISYARDPSHEEPVIVIIDGQYFEQGFDNNQWLLKAGHEFDESVVALVRFT